MQTRMYILSVFLYNYAQSSGFAFALCCIVLHCVTDFEPSQLGCSGSSVGRVLCLESRVRWVEVPPRTALFFYEVLS